MRKQGVCFDLPLGWEDLEGNWGSGRGASQDVRRETNGSDARRRQDLD